MPSSTRLDTWATATGDFIVLLEWIGKLQCPELSLWIRWFPLFKKSHNPGNLTASTPESRSSGKLLVTQFCFALFFLILLLLWISQSTPEVLLSYREPDFLGEVALHKPLLPSAAYGGCLPPDQPQGKDDPVAMKWRQDKLMVLCHCLLPGIFSQWIMTAQG